MYLTVKTPNELPEHLLSYFNFTLLLQEDEGCEASSKLAAMEADGLSLEVEEEGEQSLSEEEQDNSVKQVTLFKFYLNRKTPQVFPTFVDCVCGDSG